MSQVMGADQHFIMKYAAWKRGKPLVIDFLDDCKSLGMNTVRLWAFANGESWNALQRQPRKFTENTFRGLGACNTNMTAS